MDEDDDIIITEQHDDICLCSKQGSYADMKKKESNCEICRIMNFP